MVWNWPLAQHLCEAKYSISSYFEGFGELEIQMNNSTKMGNGYTNIPTIYRRG